jgi:hypothetical protein
MANHPTLNFVHIPKTAGTSFRVAAAAAWGGDAVLLDYAADSPNTSDLVREKVYETPDPEGFAAAVHRNGIRMISGHMRADKYLDLCGAANTVVFLREPLQRLMSEYHHFVEHHGFGGGFRDFYRWPEMIDRQLAYLAGLPLSDLGFVGLTERYPESLARFNRRYGTNLIALRVNRGRPSAERNWELPAEHEAELRELNAGDLALYRQALALFDGAERASAT